MVCVGGRRSQEYPLVPSAARSTGDESRLPNTTATLFRSDPPPGLLSMTSASPSPLTSPADATDSPHNMPMRLQLLAGPQLGSGGGAIWKPCEPRLARSTARTLRLPNTT